MIRKYSDLFSTLYDEAKPVGYLGRGTHYSVLRAVVWDQAAFFHDFAVIWDEDHDTRIIWIAEQLYLRRMLSSVIALGERKGGVTMLTLEKVSPAFCSEALEITENVPTDCFNAEVELFSEASSMIINDRETKVGAYLAGIDALWDLGPKPVELDVSAFRMPSVANPLKMGL